MHFKSWTMAIAFVLASGAVIVPNSAEAYDPCQRAQNQHAEIHAVYMKYIRNNCPANATQIPGQCRNKQRGWKLHRQHSVALNAVRQWCN